MPKSNIHISILKFVYITPPMTTDMNKILYEVSLLSESAIIYFAEILLKINK